MKKSALAFASLLLAASSLPGFIDLDRGGITLETELFLQNDSNIRGSSLNESDTIISLDPTLHYRRQARGSIDASLGVNFLRFDKFDNYDSENLHGSFAFRIPVAQGSPLSGGFSASYQESSRVDEFVNDRVFSEATNFSLDGQYRIRPRLSVRGRAGYTDRTTSFYSDMTEKSGSLGLLFDDVWQDVGVTLDYNYRDLNTSGDIGFQRDGVDEALSIGLTGQILPQSMFNKLEAYASVSLQKVDSTITGTSGGSDVLGYDGRLSWSPRDTTTFNLSFSRRVQNTIDDQTVTNSTLDFGVEQILSRLMRGSLSVFQRDIEYFGTTRNETRYGANASLSFVLGRNWSAGARISYEESDSSDTFYTFDRTQIGLFSVFTF